MTKKWMITLGILMLFNRILFAQKHDSIQLDFSQYLETVKHNNLEYAAQKFNVDLAETEIIGAKAFPDPELQFAYFDNGESKKQLGVGYTGEIDWTIELGGKRKARVNLAKSQYELTKLILSDYFKNLKADASLIFLEAIYKKEILNVKENSYQMMKEFAAADSIRFKLGVITETDARQSKLEASTFANEIIQAQTDYLSAKNKMKLFMGMDNQENSLNPFAELKNFQEDYIEDDLINIALNNRSDLMVAMQNKNVSQQLIELAKANRKIDLGINLAIDHTTVARNPDAFTPQFTQIKGGLSIPLKFSNRYNNELKMAQIQFKQNETVIKQVELQIKSEVKESILQYENYRKQAQQFNLKMLDEAKLILDAKKYSYKRGNSSLLETLDSQRSYNEIQTNYLETLYNCAVANIILNKVIGN